MFCWNTVPCGIGRCWAVLRELSRFKLPDCSLIHLGSSWRVGGLWEGKSRTRHRFSGPKLGLESVEISRAGVGLDWSGFAIPGEFWGLRPRSGQLVDRPQAPPAPDDPGPRGIGYLDLDVGFPRMPRYSRIPKVTRIPKKPRLTT